MRGYKVLKVKDPDGAGYPDGFNTEGSHDLTKVARFESYRGFLFGSLNPDVPSLAAHLGETTKIIDLMVDQSPEGLEVLRGASTYVYDGNWKLQTENGADGYRGALELHCHHAAAQAGRAAGQCPRNKSKRHRQAAHRLHTVRTFGRWDCINARQRERA